jgi:hypothetical protein
LDIQRKVDQAATQTEHGVAHMDRRTAESPLFGFLTI